MNITSKDEELHQALTQIGTGVFSPAEPGRYRDLLDSLINFGDHYQVLADYRSYVDCQDKRRRAVSNTRKSGPHKAMLNIANMGYFSSDRTIKEYAEIYLAYRPGKAVSQSMQHHTTQRGHPAPLCCVANVLFGKVPGRIQAIAGIYY